jgi:cytochrome c biogenesis protein CcmG, thiol:disulfide interchange protein DsbE
VTVNKRLLFGSLAVATAVIVVAGVIASSRSDAGTNSTDIDNGDAITLTSDNDLSPTIGTNAVVTGTALPHVNLQTQAGDDFATADLVGKPMVVNFWYSTCAPCKKELPAFAAAHAKYGDQVRFVGVDSLPPSEHEEAFARDKGVQYELFYDTNGELSSAVGVAAWPQSLFVNAQGEIVEQTGELTADELDELIRTKLL